MNDLQIMVVDLDNIIYTLTVLKCHLTQTTNRFRFTFSMIMETDPMPCSTKCQH